MPTPAATLHSPSPSERNYAAAFEYDPDDSQVQTLQVIPAPKSTMMAASKVSAAVAATPTATATGTTSSLVAKIRKQAKELSELHEELAAKDKTIHKLQHSRLHGTTTSSASRGKAESEEWKAKFYKEQKKYEVCLKKLRETKAALDEKDAEKLRVVQHSTHLKEAMADLIDRRRHEQPEDGDSQKTDEERVYTRILEEAIQLKAEEFHVGGQAELMIVLAELRQTIQAQEERLAEKENRILELQVAQQAKSLQDLASAGTSVDAITKQKEAIMDYAQSLTEKQRSADSQAPVQVATLKRLHDATDVELKATAERYTALSRDFEATVAEKARLAAQVTELQALSMEKDQRLSAVTDDYQGKMRQFHEMKTLQDDLLNGISDAKEKELKWKKKADELKRSLGDATDDLARTQAHVAALTDKQANMDADSAAWKAQVDELTQALHDVQAENDVLVAESNQRAEFDSSFVDIKEHRRKQAAVVESERALRADLHMIDVFVTSPHHQYGHAAKKDDDESACFVEWFIVGDVVSRVALLDTRRMPPQLVQRLPRLAAYLNEVFVAVGTLIKHVATVDTSWKRERFNLVAARDAFEASANLIQNELEMMRRWSFQLHDELQQTTRTHVEVEQRLRATEAQAEDAACQVKELQQSYGTCLQTLRAAQHDMEQLQREMTLKENQRLADAIELEELSNRVAKLQQLQQEAAAQVADATHALKEAQFQLQESQAQMRDYEAQQGAKDMEVHKLRMDLQEQAAVADECAALRHQLDELHKGRAITADEKRRQLDAMQRHVSQLETAVWDAFLFVQPLLPKTDPGATKPEDAQMVLRTFPQLIERLVAHQVKAHTHASMKEALLKNCQSVDYQDPSLSLLRELKLDLQQLMDENHALKAQLSGCRVGIMSHLFPTDAPQKEETTMRMMLEPIQPRNAEAVEGLRRKFKAPMPTKTETTKSASYVTAEEYVKSVKAATTGSTTSTSLEDQLERLHAAFASFRTEV
ncbi:Aste57867_14692 [Aphanomyces stellatus]|uniref:Aste57867_14692 protein n=1 Tax=Aphanomyces stellatus TaxID=120398 RepID=A0A485L1C2_9STRA|nr:hypothetical protein As57867_014637 [Aphanomyces stellatus]VFT91510.1 Aste57867_14692 [Aphanomyces stellatus]